MTWQVSPTSSCTAWAADPSCCSADQPGCSLAARLRLWMTWLDALRTDLLKQHACRDAGDKLCTRGLRQAVLVLPDLVCSAGQVGCGLKKDPVALLAPDKLRLTSLCAEQRHTRVLCYLEHAPAASDAELQC